MTRIAFILLTHRDPEGVIAQARRLVATGDYVSIHFDANAPQDHFDQIYTALQGNSHVLLVKKRIKCGWGEWSLVAATLSATQAALEAFPNATHFYMLSGDCMPIKSAEFAHDFLDKNDLDFIECFDFFESGWIKTGIKKERLIYRHWFNERSHKWLFYASMKLQGKLGLTRMPPADIQMMIGSQWWCLRRETVEKVMHFSKKRRDVTRFFSTTWIPDETFFQTLVAHLVPKEEIVTRTLTYLMFTDYGMPATFYNDHYELLLRQDYLFARKISSEALELRQRLGALWQTIGRKFTISHEGPKLFRFLTERGRVGRRFAPRFWESEGSAGRDRTVMLIVAKKWHVAKRLTAQIRQHANIPAIDYLFNEEDSGLPSLGGVGDSLSKRHRHRRALLRLLFNEYKSDQLVICVDPEALSLINDFVSDKAQTKILLIESSFSEDYLRGHIKRLGLASDSTPDRIVQEVLQVVRSDLLRESERLHDARYEHFEVVKDNQSSEKNAAAITRFLNVSDEVALKLANTPNLFVD